MYSWRQGKIHSLIAYDKLSLSDMKVKILLNSWYFLMFFLFTLPLIDTVSFQWMKSVKVVHIVGKF